MRSTIIFAFLAVAFTAVLAAPHASKSVSVVAKDEKSLVGDLIGAIIGIDVDAVIAQTEATLAGLERVGNEATTELETILVSAGAGVVGQAQAIIDNALARAQEILEPIIKLINQIISLIPGAKKDLIGDLIEALIKNLLNKLNQTIADLQLLAVETVNSLIALAEQTGSDTVSAVTALAANTLRNAALEIQPLLDLLAPILTPTPIDEIIADLIEAVTGLDIPAIVTQIDVTINGLTSLLTSSSNELNNILVQSGINVQQELQAVVDNAVSEANEILKPIISLINLILGLLGVSPAGAVRPQDLISTIIEQLFKLIENSVTDLQQLLVDTVNDLVAVAVANGANATGQIDALAQRTLAQAEALIQPLLDLLAPILPPSKRIIV